MIYNIDYKPFGNQAILIEWPQEVNEIILKDIINFKTKIKSENNNNIEDLINGYSSLTIKYTNEFLDFKKEIEALKQTYLKKNIKVNTKAVTWEIPVCYDDVFGIDLKALSKEKNTSIENIINIHSKTIYTVYFIGFLPGFLYLGGLNNTLFAKRKATPRLNIVKGSVAIGGKQTGIYPSNSAGGWNIIGRTPISFFDIERQQLCFAKSGDKIKFTPITKAIFFQLEKDIQKDIFKLKYTEDD